MVSSINFGSFSNIGGKPVASGISSGLDTESIIKSLVDARSIPATKIEDRITNIGDQQTALESLRTLLSNFQNAADLLRNPPGLNNAVNNVFEHREVFLTSSDSNTASSYLGVSANPGASIGSYDIEIVNLAEKQVSRSATQTSKTADLVNGSTIFQIRDTSNNVMATITLEDNDSLIDIAAEVNAVSDTTGVKASILQISENDFRLVFESKETGVDNGFNLNFTADPGGLSAQLGFTTQAAEDANITFNGITNVTRSSNVINDIVTGVTFTLFQETPTAAPATTITAEVTENQSLVTSGVASFVEAYNALRTFAAEQQERNTDGTFKDTAVLRNNITLTTTLSRVNAELSRVVDGLTGGDPNKLSDLGLGFADQDATEEDIAVSHILTFNESQFASALSNDFDAVRRVFEFRMTSNSSELAVYSRTNALDVSEFTLDVDYAAALDVSEGVDIDDTAIFGVNASADPFVGLTDGIDQFTISLTVGTTVTDYEFTYVAGAPAAQQFNSLDNLATAINAISGLDATVENGKLVIGSSSSQGTLAFSNSGGTADFVTAIGLQATELLNISEAPIAQITYDEGNGPVTINGTFNASTDRSTGLDITETAIFGASLPTEVFSGLANGDAFTITLTNPRGGTVVKTFTYQDTAPTTASGQFNSLSTLATAINAQTGLSASVQSNKLVISPEFAFDALTFANSGAPDFITNVGLQDTSIIGGSITTPEDSAVEGLTMVFSNENSETVNVTVTQGIGDRIYNTLSDITTKTIGILDVDANSLTESEETLQATLDRLNTQIETFRQTLLAQFSALEKAVNSMNSILQFLTAQTEAQQNQG
ncbi:MAG: hypothetical protein K0R63_1163 [Rickettsiales bacterium]|jgi:flagellar hook-associated protein 2|nr:hypothetical protein [Rickettsiales bacterium]